MYVIKFIKGVDLSVTICEDRFRSKGETNMISTTYNLYYKNRLGETVPLATHKTRKEVLNIMSECTGYSVSTLDARMNRLKGVTVETIWNIKNITIDEKEGLNNDFRSL